MKKVLLVDDEFLVCNYLRSLIVWEDYGFTIAGQAQNGVDALEKMERLRPQVVFLDVSMPVMDGVEVCRLMHERYPETHIVMLSSYSDYDYVRETMRLGAADYVLKHRLDAGELIRILQSLPAPPPAGAPEGEQALPMGDPPAGGSLFSILRDSRTRSFFEGHFSEAPPAVARLDRPFLAVARLHFSFLGDGPEKFLQALLTSCVQVVSEETLARTVYMGNYEMIFLFPPRPGEPASQTRRRVCHRMGVLHDAVLKYHNAYLIWRCSPTGVAASDMPLVYAGQLRELSGDTPEQDPGEDCQLSLEAERKIINSVLASDAALLRETLEGVFSPLSWREVLPAEMALLAGDLLTLAARLYREHRCVFRPPENQEILSLSPHRLHTFFEEVFAELIRTRRARERFSPQVTAIIGFVSEHYGEDIGLAEVAADRGLSPTYTSALFKKETGCGLVTFLNRLRVHNAVKLMLLEEAAPTQVYERVGFNSYNSFFHTFRAMTGQSPSQFLKSNGTEWLTDFRMFPGQE